MQALEDDLGQVGENSATGQGGSINGGSASSSSGSAGAGKAPPPPARRLALAQVGLLAHSVQDLAQVGSKTLRKLISAAKTSLGMFGQARSRASSQVDLSAPGDRQAG